MAAFKIIIVALAAVCLAQAQTPVSDDGRAAAVTAIQNAMAGVATVVANAVASVSGGTTASQASSASVQADSTAKINSLLAGSITKATTATSATCATTNLAIVKSKAASGAANVTACLAAKVAQFATLQANITSSGSSGSFNSQISNIALCSSETVIEMELLCILTELAKADDEYKRITTSVNLSAGTSATLQAGIAADLLWCEIIHVSNLQRAVKILNAC